MLLIHYSPETGEVLATYPAGTAVSPPPGYAACEADEAMITVIASPDQAAVRMIDLAALPPPPSLAEIKAGALKRVVAYADRITARITGRYPAAEVASWPTQEAEALRVQAGGAAGDAPLIAAMAAAAGMSPSDFAALVLAKAAAYRQIVAAVQATRSQAEALIGSCQSAAEVEAALVTLRGEADAQAQAMGLA